MTLQGFFFNFVLLSSPLFSFSSLDADLSASPSGFWTNENIRHPEAPYIRNGREEMELYVCVRFIEYTFELQATHMEQMIYTH